MSASLESRFLVGIINRLCERLPINSGIPMQQLENDEILNQCIVCLQDIALTNLRDVLSIIVQTIDQLIRATPSSQIGAQTTDDIVVINHYASQLLLLRIVENCVGLYWKKHIEKVSNDRKKKASNPNELYVCSTEEALSRVTYMSSVVDNAAQRDNQDSSKRTLPDPPPLEETVAKNVLALAAKFASYAPIPQGEVAHQVTNISAFGTGFSQYHRTPKNGVATVESPYLCSTTSPIQYPLFFQTSAMSKMFQDASITSQIQAQSTVNGNTSTAQLSLSPTVSDIQYDLYRSSLRIITFLSASNWNVVFSRIKVKFAQNGQSSQITKGSTNNLNTDASRTQESDEDINELKWIEISALNLKRLEMIVDELTFHIKGFSKRTVFHISVFLRRAIMNWIDNYQSEFQQLYTSASIKTQDSSAIDTMFDLFQSLYESTKKKALLWPTITLLIVLCPVQLSLAALNNGEKYPEAQKKIAFIDLIRKSIKGKNPEIAYLCAVDIIKASMCVSKTEGAPLRIISASLDSEIKEKLLQDVRTLPYIGSGGPDEENEIDPKLMIELLVGTYKLNPWVCLRTVIPLILDPQAPSGYKLVFIRMITSISGEVNPLAWNPVLDSSLAAPLRQLFLDSITKDRPVDIKAVGTTKKLTSFNRQHDKRAKKAYHEEMLERQEILISILGVWNSSPFLVFLKDNAIISTEELLLITNAIISCLSEFNRITRKLAENILCNMVSHGLSVFWDGSVQDWRSYQSESSITISEKYMKVYWPVTSQILLSTSRFILEQLGDIESLQFVIQLSTLRNDSLEKRKKDGNILPSNLPTIVLASNVLNEVSILYLLMNTWGDGIVVGRYIGLWLKELLRQCDIIGEVGRNSNPLYENYETYISISSHLIVGSNSAGGVKALQKRIRSEVRNMRIPTISVLVAWDEIYKCWKSYLPFILKREIITSTSGTALSIVNSLAVNANNAIQSTSSIMSTDKTGVLQAVIASPTPDPTVNYDEETMIGMLRVRHLKRIIAGSNASPTTELSSEDRAEWLNFTSFLCTLGGLYRRIQEYQDTQSLQNKAKIVTSQVNAIISSSLKLTDTATSTAYKATNPSSISSLSILQAVHPNCSYIIDKFLAEMIDLMIYSSMGIIREAVKENLGTEVGHLLYNQIFYQFTKLIDSQLGLSEIGLPVGIIGSKADNVSASEKYSEKNVILVDSIIGCLRLALDRNDFDTVLSGFVLQDVDLTGLLVKITNYFNWSDIKSLRLKLRVCQLIDSIIQKKEQIGVRGEMRLRKQTIDELTSWGDIDKLILIQNDPSNCGINSTEDISKIVKAQLDIDVAKLKSLSYLFDNFPIQAGELFKPKITTHSIQSNVFEVNDCESYKEKMMNKYCNAVLSILTKWGIISSKTVSKPESSFKSNASSVEPLAWLQSFGQATYIAVIEIINSQYASLIRENAVLGLTKLIGNNVDVGISFLKGYMTDCHSNSLLLFTDVLSNVIRVEDIQDKFSLGLGDSSIINKDRYTKLVKLITTEEGIKIAVAFGQVTSIESIDEIAGLLLAIYEARDRSLDLIEKFVEKEVDNTEGASSIFRRNSMATRLLTIYARLQGSEYIASILRPVLVDLLKQQPPLSFEIDPIRAGPNDDVQANFKNLTNATQSFLNQILNSIYKFPKPLKDICAVIWKIVGERFPESRQAAVGGFIFLRFICPAIVSPDQHNLIPEGIEVTKEFKRGLILITKIIQNLANNMLFGAKESFMVSANDFLRDNSDKVSDFLKTLAISSSNEDTTVKEIPQKTTVSKMDVMRLNRQLVLSLEKIERYQQSFMVPSRLVFKEPSFIDGCDNLSNTQEEENINEDVRHTIPKKLFIHLISLLSQLGAPQEVSPRVEGLEVSSSKNADAAQLYNDFMQRMNVQFEIEKDIVRLRKQKWLYAHAPTDKKFTYLYFIARKFNHDNLEPLVTCYYILSIMKLISTGPYVLIVDATFFSNFNEWPISWMQRLQRLYQSDFTSNLQAVHFFGVNTEFRSYAKRAIKVLGHFATKKISFTNTVQELLEITGLPENELKLPEETLAFNNDYTNGTIVGQLYRIKEPRQLVLSVMKLGNETVTVLASKKTDIDGIGMLVLDTYHISQIDEILPLRATSPDEKEFVVKVFDRRNNANSTNTSSIVFTSPKAEFIMQHLILLQRKFRFSPGSYLSVRPGWKIRGVDNFDESFNDLILTPSLVQAYIFSVSLLNMFSDDLALRRVSYNTLCAAFDGFKIEDITHPVFSDGLVIPQNPTKYVSALSKELSSVLREYSIDFLIESVSVLEYCDSSDTQLRIVGILAPWIDQAYALFSISAVTSDVYRKMKKFIVSLLYLTVKAKPLTFPLLNVVWMHIAEYSDLVPFVIDILLASAVHYGVATNETEQISHVLASLSKVYPVSTKLLVRLRKTINTASQRPTELLIENPLWIEMIVLLRLIRPLTFADSDNSLSYLPDLFHIVTMMCGVGPKVVKLCIHSTVINSVQSLYSLPDCDRNVLQGLLKDLLDPKLSLPFGIAGTFKQDDKISWDSTAEITLPDSRSEVSLSGIELVIKCLYEVLSKGIVDPVKRIELKSRWMSLVASTAFHYNPAIQPRAFLALGFLARDNVDDDLLYQVLVALRGALGLFEENSCNLIVSILMCMTNIVDSLSRESRYLTSIFWLSISILRIGHPDLYIPTLNLMNVTLNSISKMSDCMEGKSLNDILVQASEPLKGALSKTDTFSILTLTADKFPLSMCAALTRTLSDPKSRPAAVNTIHSLIRLNEFSNNKESNGNDTNIGYWLMLLPIGDFQEDIVSKLHSASSEDSISYDQYDSFIDSDVDGKSFTYKVYNNVAIKLKDLDFNGKLAAISYVILLLSNSVYDTDSSRLYTFLAIASKYIPEIFKFIVVGSEEFANKLSKDVVKSQSSLIVKSAEAIIEAIVAVENINSPYPKGTLLEDALQSIGLAGLLNSAIIKDLSKEQKYDAVLKICSLVENIIEI